jgi:hypothetical protein
LRKTNSKNSKRKRHYLKKMPNSRSLKTKNPRSLRLPKMMNSTRRRSMPLTNSTLTKTKPEH